MCLNGFVHNIFPNIVDHMLDSIDSPTRMVSSMTQRDIARKAPQRVYSPLPEGSAFVAPAGAAIPQPMVTTEMITGRQTRATRVAHREEGSQVAATGRANIRQRNTDVGRGRGAAPDAGRARGAALDAGRGTTGRSVHAWRGRGARNPTAGRGRA